MGGEIWVLDFSRLAHSQLRAVWANSRGGDIYCMRLTFGRVCLQSGSSLNSFPFCNHLGYGAVILLTFHLRFCFCLKSHLKRAGRLLATSTRQLMPFRAWGKEKYRRQLTAHPDISLSLACKLLVRSAFHLFFVQLGTCCTAKSFAWAEHPVPTRSCCVQGSAQTSLQWGLSVPAVLKGLWAQLCFQPCNTVKLHRSHFHPHQQGFRPTNPLEGQEADVCHLLILLDFG